MEKFIQYQNKLLYIPEGAASLVVTNCKEFLLKTAFVGWCFPFWISYKNIQKPFKSFVFDTKKYESKNEIQNCFVFQTIRRYR